jgi:hypothetical protein
MPLLDVRSTLDDDATNARYFAADFIKTGMDKADMADEKRDDLGPCDGRGRFLWVKDADGNRLSKTCPRCLRHLSVEAFIGSYCNECKLAVNRANYHKGDGKVKQRERYRARTYGLSPTDVLKMLEEQGGVCALCGIPHDKQNARTRAGDPAPFNVDHCHRTGRVRGMLCRRCNLGIGVVENIGVARFLAYIGWPDS